MTQRTERIDELLRQEIGQALEREVTDPGIGFVTVTQVETSPDLGHARVWVSVIGSEERRKESLAALRRAMPYIRHGLASKIRLRRIPELDVRLDDTAERGTRILKIINDLEAGRSPDEASGALESLPTPVPRLGHEGDSREESPPDKTSSRQSPRTPRKARARGSRGGGSGTAGQSGHADRVPFRRRPR